MNLVRESLDFICYCFPSKCETFLFGFLYAITAFSFNTWAFDTLVSKFGTFIRLTPNSERKCLFMIFFFSFLRYDVLKICTPYMFRSSFFCCWTLRNIYRTILCKKYFHDCTCTVLVAHTTKESKSRFTAVKATHRFGIEFLIS